MNNRRAVDIQYIFSPFWFNATSTVRQNIYRMNYDQDIKRILWEAGTTGLSVRKIARHLYNLHNGLFEVVAYEDIYQAVVNCVSKNRKSKSPFIENVGKRGIYRLTEKSCKETQLMFEFKDEPEEAADNKTYTDQSLSLF